MAGAKLTDFLVKLCLSDAMLKAFQDDKKRGDMLAAAEHELDGDTIKAFEFRNHDKMFDLIITQQAGTGFTREKDANRLAAKARKSGRKNR